MYSKCGSLADACNVFEGMPNRGVITWSAMLAGYALHNEYDVVLECFEEMQKIGIKPNHITFLSLLSACGHKGLIEKAYDYFYSMRAGYGIKPATEHYNCMIDLLGRAGRVDEAEYLLLTMPYKNKFLSWKSLLSHSKVYRNVQLGRRCFDHLIAIDSGDASLYALMLDIYAEANMWKEVREIQEMKNSACARRSPAKAIIPVGTVVHDFIDGDQRHAESCRIYARLKEIGKKMDEQKLFLHLPPIWKLRSIDEDKDDGVGVHCELLATVFGLMVTDAGTTMRIAKNLKICRDCHTAIKFISKFEKREIMLMDNACVHHIRDGLCSCKDLF
jgi:pentatricopeptide repeat protein